MARKWVRLWQAQVKSNPRPLHYGVEREGALSRTLAGCVRAAGRESFNRSTGHDALEGMTTSPRRGISKSVAERKLEKENQTLKAAFT